VFTGHRKLDFVVDNPTDSIGYIGLSLNPGRTIVIEPSCYPVDMCVQEKYVLAHTNNTDLILNSTHQGIPLTKGLRYFMIVSK